MRRGTASARLRRRSATPERPAPSRRSVSTTTSISEPAFAVSGCGQLHAGRGVELLDRGGERFAVGGRQLRVRRVGRRRPDLGQVFVRGQLGGRLAGSMPLELVLGRGGVAARAGRARRRSRSPACRRDRRTRSSSERDQREREHCGAVDRHCVRTPHGSCDTLRPAARAPDTRARPSVRSGELRGTVHSSARSWAGCGRRSRGTRSSRAASYFAWHCVQSSFHSGCFISRGSSKRPVR